jgi:hypothetical protein
MPSANILPENGAFVQIIEKKEPAMSTVCHGKKKYSKLEIQKPLLHLNLWKLK